MAVHVVEVDAIGRQHLRALDEPLEQAAVVEVERGELCTDDMGAVLQAGFQHGEGGVEVAIADGKAAWPSARGR